MNVGKTMSCLPYPSHHHINSINICGMLKPFPVMGVVYDIWVNYNISLT